MSDTVSALRAWPARRWWVAVIATVVTLLIIGLPTDVVPNPVFGRSIDVTWWSYPALVVAALLGGVLAATYIRTGNPAAEAVDSPGKLGAAGGFIAYLAVGCPVCNKLVLLALGTTGAMQWFAPVQPYLAVLGVVLLLWALRVRLRGEAACPVEPVKAASR